MAKNLSEYLNGKIALQKMYICFDDGKFYADFTGMNAYWKQMQKNLNKLLLGNSNYKLPVLDKREQRFRYNFSKCVVTHDFWNVYSSLLKETLSGDGINSVQNDSALNM